MNLFDQFKPALSFHYFFRDEPATNFFDAAEKFDAKELAFVNQIHSSKTIVVRDELHGTIDADGLITDTKDLTLAIRFADCQNFLVYEPKKKVLGLLHAGWRGVSNHAIERCYETMKKEWDIEPSETFVLAGPSLCKKCAVFTDPVNELPAHLSAFIDGQNVDLIGFSEETFEKLGIPASQRERQEDCTLCKANCYFSFRHASQESAAQKNATERNFLLAKLR